MKYLIAAALLATTVAGFAPVADAAGGCGAGFHRGPYGGCVLNRGAVVVRRPPVVVVRPPVVYRRLPSWWCPAPASAPRHGLVCRTLPLLSVTSRITAKTPLTRGFLLGCLPRQACRGQHGNGRTESRPPESICALTSSNGGASSDGGGASGGDASPNDGGGASRGDASPSRACPIPCGRTAAPAHLFGRKTIDLVAGRDRRLRIAFPGGWPSPVSGCGARGAASASAPAASAAAPAANPKASFRKWRRSMTSPSSRQCGVMRGEFDRGEMNAR